MHAVAQLLHVGVLVGGTLVAVDRDALVHHLAVEVTFLAERLHDQLLEVAREEEQAVLVREHHHVLGALAAAGVVPHQCKQRRRVGGDKTSARCRVHRARAVQHGVDVDALQRRRQ